MSLGVSAALQLATATDVILWVNDIGSCSELCWLVYLILNPFPRNGYKHLKKPFLFCVQ
jgi:hypothetical protein